MLLGELICTLGFGLLAPEQCLPADPALSVNAVCDKHDDTLPASGEKAQSAAVQKTLSASGIDQTCKAEMPADIAVAK